jgi:hypothetical protein
MAEAAFIVPLLPVSQTGWRLLCHYYDGDSASRVLMCKNMSHTLCVLLKKGQMRALQGFYIHIFKLL